MPRIITTNMSINNGDVERRYRNFSDYCLRAKPDILAVQEVSLDYGHAALLGLSRKLGYGFRFIYEPVYPGQEDSQGVGVLTRLPIKESGVFEAPGGGNKLQLLSLIAEAGSRLAMANVHLEAHLLADFSRRRKLEALKDRLNADVPQLLAGDFNAFPRLPSIRLMKSYYSSAHEISHGKEPAYTYPTALGEKLLRNGDASRRQRFAMRLGARIFQASQNRCQSGLPRVVADYVFVNQLVRVEKTVMTGHDELELAHSDHLGLQVDFSVS